MRGKPGDDHSSSAASSSFSHTQPGALWVCWVCWASTAWSPVGLLGFQSPLMLRRSVLSLRELLNNRPVPLLASPPPKIPPVRALSCVHGEALPELLGPPSCPSPSPSAVLEMKHALPSVSGSPPRPENPNPMARSPPHRLPEKNQEEKRKERKKYTTSRRVRRLRGQRGTRCVLRGTCLGY